MKSRWELGFVALAVIALSIGGPSRATEAKTVFLTPSEYDPALLLPPPPADNSQENKMELAELHQIQNQKTPEQVAKAKKDSETENASIFEEALGGGFTLVKFPATAKLMADVRNDEKEAVGVAKDYFQRSRPWIVDATLSNCERDDAPKSSYPSGHTTMGFSMAVVLSSLAPEKAQALLARADEYGHNRLVCEVHWRHDVQAGEAYGTALGQALLRNAAFRKDYDAAQAELKAGHIIP